MTEQSPLRLAMIALAVAWCATEVAAQVSPRLGRTRRMVPVIGPSYHVYGATGDVDGDGLDDLVLGGGPVRLWLATPEGRLEDSGFSIATTDATFPLLFDFDLDGDQDLALARPADCDPHLPSCSGGQNLFYENDGSGGLSDATFRFPVADGETTRSMAAGDVTGDGLPDLVLAQVEHCWDDLITTPGCIGGDAELWVQDGFGNFVPGVPIGSTVSIKDVEIVRLGDLDGDGDLDLYLGRRTLHRAYLNDGTGVFSEAPGLLPTPSFPGFSDGVVGTELADVEGDGDTDVITCFRINNQNEMRLYVNDGMGGFLWDANRLAASPAGPVATTPDVQGDGLPDLVLLVPFAVELLTNDGSGSFSDAGPLPEARAASAYTLDLAGDGDADLAFVETPNEVQVYLGDGTGAFARATAPIPWTADRTDAAVLLDADGDSDLDVAIAVNAGTGFLFLNDGSGQLTSVPFGDWTSVFVSAVFNLAAADLDGDGDEDLVGPGGNLFVNEGTGLRNDQTFLRPPLGFPESGWVATADLDLDGAQDVVFGSLVVHRNLGGLTFEDLTNVFPSGATVGPHAFGDVDGDGAPDMVGAQGTLVGGSRLFLNRPAGFVDASALVPTSSSAVTSYSFGDVDLDGDLDLLVGTGSQSTSPPDELYLNTGTGFADVSATNLPAFPDRTRAVSLVDLDLDGDLDAFVANEFTPSRVLANDGSGVFADLPAAMPSPSVRARDAATGDLDGDGDPDVVLPASFASADVLLNLRRQVAWTSFPRVGQPLDLELWGSPGAPWRLAISLDRGSFHLPALGTLFLSPATLLTVGRGALDGTGHASNPAPLPADPALVGLDVYMQALIGSPLRLSNLEVVRITGF